LEGHVDRYGLSGTPEQLARICEGTGIGSFAAQASRLAGVSVSTFDDWFEQGRAGVEPLNR
jgi:hypothetical protein